MNKPSPHQLLANIAEHKRDKEADALQQLTTYRAKLVSIIEQSQNQVTTLLGQRDIKVAQGVEALELLLLEESVFEHQQHILDVNSELMVLDEAISQQKKKWRAAHKLFKAHEKLDQQAKRKSELLVNQKTQRTQDDQFVASMMRKRRASI